jgi:hypothetical protein
LTAGSAFANLAERRQIADANAKEANAMKQTKKRKAISFSEALSQAGQQGRRGPGLHKLQQVMDMLEESQDSEVFFELLYDKRFPARRLWLAINKMGIKTSYQSVLRWRELHTSKNLIFQNGKVLIGKRQLP